jgi:ankyrin repeat protein
MRTVRRRRAALITLLILVGLLAIPVVLTWREVRQEGLNQALIVAADRNDTTGVRSLLKRGADPNVQVLPADKRPVWKRIWNMLQHRPNPSDSARDSDWTGPEIAHESVLMKAVEWYPTDSTDVDNADTIDALAHAGANVNFRVTYLSPNPGLWNLVPVHTTPLIEAGRLGKWKTLQVLLAHHADVNAADQYGNTALMYAATYRNVAAVKALLTRGARADTKDDAGETALFWVFDLQESSRHIHTGVGRFDWVNEQTRSDRRAIVAWLIRYGTSVDNKNNRGDTAMSLVYDRDNKKLIQMLKHASAK